MSHKLRVVVKGPDKEVEIPVTDRLICFIDNQPILYLQKTKDFIAILRCGDEGFEEILKLLGYPCNYAVHRIPVIGNPANITNLELLAKYDSGSSR